MSQKRSVRFKRFSCVFLSSSLILALSLSCKNRAESGGTIQNAIIIDGSIYHPSHIFEGVGCQISVGAVRNIIDFKIEHPKQYNEIIKLLFAPNYGASLDRAKFEIGGDENAGIATVPSVMHTENEYHKIHQALQSGKQNEEVQKMFDRDYNLDVAHDALKINQDLEIEFQQGTAPYWIVDEKSNFPCDYSNENPDDPYDDHGDTPDPIYTQKNINRMLAYVKGADIYRGVKTDYLSAMRNETSHNKEFTKALRKQLDAANLNHIKITMYEHSAGTTMVFLRNQLERLFDSDLEYKNAIDIIGGHYFDENQFGGSMGSGFFKTLQDKGMKVWSGEDGYTNIFWRNFKHYPDRWYGTIANAAENARVINGNHIEQGALGTMICMGISAWYHAIGNAKLGLIDAGNPWDGHYDIYPKLWAIAHTTQFADRGWIYLGDSARGYFKNKVIPNGGDYSGNYVTLVEPNTGNYTMVISTVRAADPQTITLRPLNLSKGKLTLWETTGPATINNQDSPNWFHVNNTLIIDRRNDNGTVTLSNLKPDSIYTLTTTSRGYKGVGTGEDQVNPNEIPKAYELPLGYADDFENDIPGKIPSYLSDFNGCFEVKDHDNGPSNPGKKCLIQQAPKAGVKWFGIDQFGQLPTTPLTVMGSAYWNDYSVIVDAKMMEKNEGRIELWGRVWGEEGQFIRWSVFEPVCGIHFDVNKDGSWKLMKTDNSSPNSGDFETDADWCIDLNYYYNHPLAQGKNIRTVIQKWDPNGWNTYQINFAGSQITVYVKSATDTKFYELARVKDITTPVEPEHYQMVDINNNGVYDKGVDIPSGTPIDYVDLNKNNLKDYKEDYLEGGKYYKDPLHPDPGIYDIADLPPNACPTESGMIGLGSDYSFVAFDNLKITPDPQSTP